MGLGVEARADPFGPDLQLFDGRRPESVASRHQHLAALHLGAVGELGDGRGLARAVAPTMSTTSGGCADRGLPGLDEDP